MGELAILGLRAEEEEIYRFLTGRPGCTLAEIDAAVDLGRTRQDRGLAEILLGLEVKGLITRTPEAQPVFVPANPDVALGALIAERENELQGVRELTFSLLKRFHEVHRSAAPDRLVEVITGADAVRPRIAQLRRHARHQVRVLDQAPYAIESGAGREGWRLLDRGVVCRSVHERSVLGSPRQAHELRVLAASGTQVRLAASVPARLLLCDDRFALLPLRDDAGVTSALLVNPSTLLQALSALFEAIWWHAKPLRISDCTDGAVTEERPSPEESRLLRLLSTGAKDEALARRLGLSARTVHRRIQLLMTRLGVTTRLQLGIEAERRGWIGHSSTSTRP